VADGAPGFVQEVVHGLLQAFPADSERIEHAGVRANAAIAAFRDALEQDLGRRGGGDFALGERWLDFRLEREHMLPLKSEALEAWGRQHVAALRRAAEQEAARGDPARPWQEVAREARRPADPGGAPEAMAAELERARRFVTERRMAPVPEVPIAVAPAHAWQRPLLADPGYLAPGAFDVEPAGLVLTPAPGAAPPAGRPPAPGPAGRRGAALDAARVGWPGRHLQRGLAIRCGSRLRRLAANTTLTGGWALYAERLAQESGWFEDPDTRLGYIYSSLGRALRLVLETAMQSLRWDQAKLTGYLQSVLGGRNWEFLRYTVMPGQACAYKTGEVQIYELREKARRELGPLFDIKDFHRWVLENGSVPFPFLAAEMERAIREKKAGR